ncbi:MAG TPA: pyruvate dehydrogenase (acetyl-transferring), homodimeric type, partial [Candidatus Dormibacteraeota bacterium]|nr:pyruvate dehydrogenase (acetyl-transferring), homodimeric type [Candidatus Dormibacteraeota bacterium]
TTMVFAAMLRNLLRDKEIGRRVVPIIPDEARTFGMDALFREVKIYSPLGQRYTSVDAGMVLSYSEASDGQILEEGITEAGAMASFTAAGTAYATHQTPMVPFYIFYSMFGYQRVGDMVWAFGDARGRGFLLGATAGRTTLNGEGLQHQDGHGHLLYSAIPNCRSYDPAYAYELAVIIRDGLRRMYHDAEDCFYYITLYNENYPQPPMPEGAEQGIVDGIHLAHPAPEGQRRRVDILASGTGMLAAVEAQRALADDHGVGANVWSVTSWRLLRDEALDCERWNRLHPGAEPRVPLVTRMLAGAGPVIAVSDNVKGVADMVGRFVPQPYVPLGTDGYGRSDTRAALRRHFETDPAHVTIAALHALVAGGGASAAELDAAIEGAGIDPEAVNPRLR